jgi:hypothetical protein
MFILCTYGRRTSRGDTAPLPLLGAQMPIRLRDLQSVLPFSRGGGAPRMVPLNGDLARAVLALGAAATAQDALSELTTDELEATERFDVAVVYLGRGIAAALLGARGAPDPAALAATAGVLLEGETRIPGELVPGGRIPDSLERAPAALLEAAGYVLREHALDRHRSELILGTRNEDGQPVAFHRPVTESQAHVWLGGYLYERVEAWVRRDWLTAAERAASEWWFSRWRAARPFRGDELDRKSVV